MEIGLSDVGIALVANVYHMKNPDGMIAAINKEVLQYLHDRDCFILGDCDQILESLYARIKELMR